jgi:hypothetical protein
MNFVIQSGYHDRGVTAVASLHPYRISKSHLIEPHEVPLGSVEWTQKVLGRNITPDYFPKFLSPFFHRKIWSSDKWPVGTRCFIKPSYSHKAWRAKIYSGRGYAGKRKGPYICSEVIRFRNEWRYYVCDGVVLSGWWYWGDSQDSEQHHLGSSPPGAPSLPRIDWPAGYCGAVDFGEMWDTGELALIEVNAPFSCGWYGEQKFASHYCDFLAVGWGYLQRSPL